MTVQINIDEIPVTKLSYDSETKEFYVETERGAGSSEDLGEAMKIAAESHRMSVKKNG